MCPTVLYGALLPWVLSSLTHIGHTQQHCKPPAISVEAAFCQKAPMEAPAGQLSVTHLSLLSIWKSMEKGLAVIF